MNRKNLLDQFPKSLESRSVRAGRNALKPNFFYYTSKPVAPAIQSEIIVPINYANYSNYPGNNSRRSRMSTTLAKNPKATILKSNNMIRFERITKTIVYVICVAVLAYYLAEFARVYSQYPTVVNVNVDIPNTSELPALTLCVRDPNQLMKNKTCAMNETICELFRTDKEDDTTIEKFMYNLSADALFDLARNTQDFFGKCEVDGANSTLCNESLRIHKDSLNCFVVNEDWFNASTAGTNLSRNAVFNLNLNLNPEDSLKLPITVDVFVHDIHELADFRTYTFAAKGGKESEISLLQSTVIMLEPPYITGCKNYTNDAEALTKSELRNFDPRKYRKFQENALGRSVCSLACQTNTWKDEYGCVPTCVPFTRLTKKCQETETEHLHYCHNPEVAYKVDNDPSSERTSFYLKYLHQCESEECPIQCKVVFYDVQTNEDDILGLNMEVNVTNQSKNRREVEDDWTKKKFMENSVTRIMINLRPIRNIMYIHTPKFTPVEAIGYVGGYVGIFLGLSIPLLYEYVVLFFAFLYRLKTTKKFALVVCC